MRKSNGSLEKGLETGYSWRVVFLMDWKWNGEKGEHPTHLYDLGLEWLNECSGHQNICLTLSAQHKYMFRSGPHSVWSHDSFQDGLGVG